jgi:hypothetical protein
MNSAPAELLQLLTIAALQPSPPTFRPATIWYIIYAVHIAARAQHEKKKPPCLNKSGSAACCFR